MVIDYYMNRIPSLEFWILLVSFSAGIMCMIMSHFWFRIIKPLKLKVNELTCWHIERPEPEHCGWSHCHEYNFAGEISITRRTEVTVKEFYLSLPMNDKTLRVDSSWSPEGSLRLITNEKITNVYSFQIRRGRQLQMPSYAYVVMEFEHGKIKRKVRLKRDDNYRPNLNVL